ncbi:zinc metalloproteinase/disintegrin-like [Microcaecilia unicolor]|uniref:Zinc metalloproteinase/disintegrin-like n=1 Tax=Microcaecilia unicolor TaxID=1415580 RepID=A0A6P7WXX0_9AMPH|nr:zinc metalloproteinase/disintegrin-like [Microcaecilia unicolor]
MNLVLLSTLLLILQDQVHGRSTLAGVKSYEVVYPRKVHTQYKRDTGGIYPDITQYELTIDGKKMLMHLERTEDLTADNYSETVYLPNGDAETSIVPDKDHCYYHGHIKNEDDSLVSISTCDGLSGYIKIGDKVYLIEPLQHTDSEEHAVYKHEDLERVPKACAVPDSQSSAQIKMESFLPGNIDGLFPTMNYIEFYVVMDHSMYKKYNYNQQALKKRIFQIINHANLLYKPLNVSLVLVGSEIWTTKDLITVNPSITVSLESFALWTLNDLRRRKNFDDTFLIT